VSGAHRTHPETPSLELLSGAKVQCTGHVQSTCPVHIRRQGARLKTSQQLAHNRCVRCPIPLAHRTRPVSAERAQPATQLHVFASVPTLKCFARHLSTELAFLKPFWKAFHLHLSTLLNPSNACNVSYLKWHMMTEIQTILPLLKVWPSILNNTKIAVVKACVRRPKYVFPILWLWNKKL